jgi:hypothetical protein
MDDKAIWQGTASELLAQLEGHTASRNIKTRTWPKSPQSLSQHLRRTVTFLKNGGLEVKFCRESGSKSRRIVTIRQESNSRVASVASVATSPTPPIGTEFGGATLRATRADDATPSATRDDPGKPPQNGLGDACDACDARNQGLSMTSQDPAQGVSTQASSYEPEQKVIPNEVIEL